MKKGLSKLIEKMYPIILYGKPTKLRDVRTSVRNDILKEALGDYIGAKDVHKKGGIKDAILRSWRKSGKIHAKKVGGSWYYSRRDLIDLMKTSK